VILLALCGTVYAAPTDIIGVFPCMLAASYTSLFLTRQYHYYPSAMQKSRNDLSPCRFSSLQTLTFIAVIVEEKQAQIDKIMSQPNISQILMTVNRNDQNRDMRVGSFIDDLPDWDQEDKEEEHTSFSFNENEAQPLLSGKFEQKSVNSNP
jgi:hypothetical protein